MSGARGREGIPKLDKPVLAAGMSQDEVKTEVFLPQATLFRNSELRQVHIHESM